MEVVKNIIAAGVPLAVVKSDRLCAGCAIYEKATSLSCHTANAAALADGIGECVSQHIFKLVEADLVTSDPMTIVSVPDPAFPVAMFGNDRSATPQLATGTYYPAHGGRPETTMPLASAGHDGRSGQAPAMHQHKEEYRAFNGIGPFTGGVRNTDPQTSRDAAERVMGGGKLQDIVMSALGSFQHGATGKELASGTGRPLNSITPRFAQLRRKGLIHDSGQRRDKQVVWKIGNGVAA